MLNYHSITLVHQSGDRKCPLVHRLVAFAFLDRDHLGQPLDPECVYEVNHKNRIRSDNRLENLEIISVKHHREKDQGKAVIAFNPVTLEGKEFKTLTLTAEHFGCSITCISKLIRSQEDREGWYFFLADDPEIEDKIEALCDFQSDPIEMVQTDSIEC
jgi:hypothetical protein